jgi:NSS family neurotransmitter:Na+ symporter
MSQQTTGRGNWASRIGFILAAAGSAIGLGNIWKFPYITGQNGGGAFVLVYLACIVLIGLPIMMAEFLIGRHAQRDAVGAFEVLEGSKSPWCLVGWLAVAASFVLFSFYAVVAGWGFAYVFKSFTSGFAGQTPDQINAMFGQLVSNPIQVLSWQVAFVAATALIVLGGVRGGIERWSKLLMPALFLLLTLLFIQGMLSPGAGRALGFMFRPDFTSLTPTSILEALGHAFFTLSLGAGSMITYGSYLDKKSDLFPLAIRITVLDTIVAIMAGLAIFPVVFAAGLEPGAGPGLVFQTIPIVFAGLPFGNILSVIFFILLSVAALSSSISILGVSVAYLIDSRGWTRLRATFTLAAAAFTIGIPCALSFNRWAGLTPLFGKTFFDFYDMMVSSYMLPLGGLLVAIYAGWFWKSDEEKSELIGQSDRAWLFPVWHFVLRYIAPAAVMLVLLNQVGLFN